MSATTKSMVPIRYSFFFIKKKKVTKEPSKKVELFERHQTCADLLRAENNFPVKRQPTGVQIWRFGKKGGRENPAGWHIGMFLCQEKQNEKRTIFGEIGNMQFLALAKKSSGLARIRANLF
jgi:hypothetical protein